MLNSSIDFWHCIYIFFNSIHYDVRNKHPHYLKKIFAFNSERKCIDPHVDSNPPSRFFLASFAYCKAFPSLFITITLYRCSLYFSLSRRTHVSSEYYLVDMASISNQKSTWDVKYSSTSLYFKIFRLSCLLLRIIRAIWIRFHFSTSVGGQSRWWRTENSIE